MRIKWTIETALQIASKFKSPLDFKKHSSAGYKFLTRNNLTEKIWPLETRQRQQEFTPDKIKQLIAENGWKFRVDLQRGNPSAYNSARRMGLLEGLFPKARNTKYTVEELKTEASKYKYRSEFEQGSPKQYQVAQKRRILNDICGPRRQGTSKPEQDVLEFLQSMQPDFKTKRFANDYELDCYSESLMIGIEYNGLYWHSEAGGKNYKYHLGKTEYFKKLGIRVVHVWEHEWRDRQSQVKNFLGSICRTNKKVGARKCVFKDVLSKEAKDFLNQTHIQGASTNVILGVGAYLDNELIGIATFGKHHRQNGLQYAVLNRMAFKPGITIQGGVQKFTKYAYERLGPLQSWADRDKSEANGYLKAGWVVKSILRPDYFYVKGDKIISKQSRKKSSVNTPKEMTEYEHALKDGLSRVWNCGKILLTYL